MLNKYFLLAFIFPLICLINLEMMQIKHGKTFFHLNKNISSTANFCQGWSAQYYSLCPGNNLFHLSNKILSIGINVKRFWETECSNLTAHLNYLMMKLGQFS